MINTLAYFVRLTLLVLSLVTAGPAALAADDALTSQAIQIEADRMDYDDAKQTNIFSGNVVLVRGSLEIHAKRLVLSQDANGNANAQASGEPARFKQVRATTGELIEGTGRELLYSDARQELQLIDSASLRKSMNGELSDEVFGGKIVYSRDTDVFTVQGASPKTSDKPGRVRVIIQPRKNGRSSSLPLKPAKPSGQS